MAVLQIPPRQVRKDLLNNFHIKSSLFPLVEGGNWELGCCCFRNKTIIVLHCIIALGGGTVRGNTAKLSYHFIKKLVIHLCVGLFMDSLFVPLIYLSIIRPIPPCPDYCSFIIGLEIREY